MAEIFHKDESYKIVGAINKVYNALGFGYQEKYYYRGLKEEFGALGFTVKEQLVSRLLYNDKIIGRYFLDFLINGSIVVEIKIANEVYPRHINQVLGYLKANNLKLGILAVFTKDRVIIKRVVN